MAFTSEEKEFINANKDKLKIDLLKRTKQQLDVIYVSTRLTPDQINAQTSEISANSNNDYQALSQPEMAIEVSPELSDHISRNIEFSHIIRNEPSSNNTIAQDPPEGKVARSTNEENSIASTEEVNTGTLEELIAPSVSEPKPPMPPILENEELDMSESNIDEEVEEEFYDVSQIEASQITVSSNREFTGEGEKLKVDGESVIFPFEEEQGQEQGLGQQVRPNGLVTPIYTPSQIENGENQPGLFNFSAPTESIVNGNDVPRREHEQTPGEDAYEGLQSAPSAPSASQIDDASYERGVDERTVINNGVRTLGRVPQQSSQEESNKITPEQKDVQQDKSLDNAVIGDKIYKQQSPQNDVGNTPFVPPPAEPGSNFTIDSDDNLSKIGGLADRPTFGRSNSASMIDTDMPEEKKKGLLAKFKDLARKRGTKKPTEGNTNISSNEKKASKKDSKRRGRGV